MAKSVIETVLEGKQLADLVPVKEVKEKTKPKMTQARVNSILEKLKDIEVNNGFMGIAVSEGLLVSQVKEIAAKRAARIIELTPVVKEKA
jgi:hypothetical protein